jgi:hypothetical protein
LENIGPKPGDWDPLTQADKGGLVPSGDEFLALGLYSFLKTSIQISLGVIRQAVVDSTLKTMTIAAGNVADDAVVAAGNGLTTAEKAGISAADARRIQNAANRTGQEITVVGSRASGAAKATSDWDYILSGNSAQRHSASSSLPRGSAGGEVYNPGIDIWQNYNPSAPGYTVVDTTRPYVPFKPTGN